MPYLISEKVLVGDKDDGPTAEYPSVVVFPNNKNSG